MTPTTIARTITVELTPDEALFLARVLNEQADALYFTDEGDDDLAAQQVDQLTARVLEAKHKAAR